jgi:DNA-binding transcriptional LysR family regulator
VLLRHDLGAIRHVICGSPQYFRKFGRPKTPQDLREHNCLPTCTRPQKLAIPKFAPPPARRGERIAVVQQQRRTHSNGSQRLWDHQSALHAVQKEIADKKLDVIFKNVSLSPERMAAYCARVKRLPAKTADFISFLKTSLRHQANS